MNTKIIKIGFVALTGFLACSWQLAYAQDDAAEQLQRLQEIQRLQQQGQADAARALARGQALPAVKASTDNDDKPVVKIDPKLLQKLQQQEFRKKAFNNMVRDQFPLTPKQVIEFHKHLAAHERAVATEPSTPPKPVASSQMVQLAPGSTPPVVRLSEGFVSSVVFLDSTGAPWPIEAYDLGNPQAFNIQWDKKSNTLLIQAIKRYTYGNIAVKLRGMNTPVMMTLIPAQKKVDYRVDMRIQGLGPNAKPLFTGDVLPNHANNELLHVLDGVPPVGAIVKKVSGANAQVWVRHNTMFVRTQATILSPSWVATMSSGDGTHAYQLLTTPLILVSEHGRVKQIKVEGL